MRPWVDPANNLLFADNLGAEGTIGYRTRGQVPVRARANAWLPVPGWDGAHEWDGVIPFEAMPAFRDPETGWIATANSRIAGPDYPHYLGLDFAPDFRTRRLVARLRHLDRATAADMAAIHADRVSIPARELVELLRRLDQAILAAPGAPAAGGGGTPPVREAALRCLHAWDGDMDRDGAAPAIYAVLRGRLTRDLLTPLLGPLASEAFGRLPSGPVTHVTRLKARLAEWIRAGDRTLLPPGTDWPAALGRALDGALA